MYKFRREDTGEVIEVPWEVMIQQEFGYITLEDGTLARRCLHLEDHSKAKRKDSRTGSKEIISDSLGFGEHQLADFEKDRKANGFSGVEFIRDPAVPEFFRVKCSSRREFNRYVAHRGMVNKNSIGGVRFTEEELEGAKEMMRRIHGDGRGSDDAG